MFKEKIKTLYEHYKNSPKKLKIICDWDEVIQAAEPYALWKGFKEANEFLSKESYKRKFSDLFDKFWGETWKRNIKVIYSPYGSRLEMKSSFMSDTSSLTKAQSEIKNSPDFYQKAPFLSIAEDLLKLIKEDKVEELIFLVYCEVLSVEGENVITDNRVELVFKEAFGKFPNCSLKKIRFVREKITGGVEVQRSKADWIKENAYDFDIFIDDNPNILRSFGDGFHFPTAVAPYYPAIENQHHSEVLLVKNEVSNLKKENFSK